MIKNKSIDRIIKYLNWYGNTIIVSNDFKGDKFENLLKQIEKQGFSITKIYHRDGFANIKEHWTIFANKRKWG